MVAIFPNEAAGVRLVGAVVLEQHEKWQVIWRYLCVESLVKIQPQGEEAVPALLAAG
ncbi:MAG: transposase [Chloroflexi bacterium]|nr:transposase [Chloroflexota bacterium]